MERWLAYIYERFPPLIYGSLALGAALSGSMINKADVSFIATLLAFIGLWGFLFALRLSNDINDIAKDKIAFPDRPLPAGKIPLPEARQLLFLLQLLLFAYSQLLWVATQGTAACFFILLASWAWLADKEFYMRPLLLRLPLMSTLIAQLYTVPMALFAVSVGQPSRVFGVKAWALAAALYGAMLTYRLCRTLSPHLHPIAAAFIHFYGYRKTFLLATTGLALSAIAAGVLHVGGLLWPVEGIVFATLIIQIYQREQYRLPEMAAAASLVLHAWSGIF